MAVDDVQLDVAAAEFLGIVGASGSGKSTLLWLVNRLLDPQRPPHAGTQGRP
ncbi:ATP-binding cassette domain-containing protein [Bradyrhizobium sp. ISRA443]|uniref:ATP-binding cassette domain-containing protein n=1 Tax=unclassified Bradyrhizobium TaxID=2631580 RepID=UPI00247A5F28|nr:MULTISPECIES: ATP-binding cassette domain-containing protein [unclassified Bradyrhizobium]WGR98045.1 ATP-binding cassette domain-containing protein [Bradyrhizobium sp. ISRA436]WGS04934.1 ATP-binding cassette domain-containing protein [Bradyrhizobium sp. ISRA437]WGS11818.1 ATP-binding cassette domain-containing protein [Bradyrhizobium sp. ISRA443]